MVLLEKKSVNDRSQVTSDLFVSSQVAQGLAVIGDRWAFLIIRDVYLGISRFEGLRNSVGASRGTLSSRLKALLDQDILAKHPYQSNPPRYEYNLTEKGLGLYPTVLMMWNWERKWGQQRYLPKTLVHKTCGQKMSPIYQCSGCHVPLTAQQTRYTLRNDFNAAHLVGPRTQRRTKSEPEKSGNINSQNMSVLDCVGDRWTALVLAAGFFGLRRFDDMASAIGLGTSVLADRLSLLVQTGVMDRIPYQRRPTRYEYRLTSKGMDLYGHTIAIHEWTERYLIEPKKGLLLLEHVPCGELFHGEVVCDQCNAVLQPHEVQYLNH